MKLILALVIFIGLFFGVTFAQQGQIALQGCGDAQMLSQSSENGKAELEFSSSSSMAKCFNDIDQQLSEVGWERIKGSNNIYKSNFYRITYSQNGEEAMLILRQSNSGYQVILDF